MADFTPAQQSAIDERQKTLLVSAAAGAGKTTTLTRRVIVSLLDEKNPADISRMLIITFTKASAADLREKVLEALEEAAEEHPEDKRLAEQITALPSAQISTVDSFFYRILREHAAEAGVSPDVRICDEAEKALLMRETMERLLQKLYENEMPEVADSATFCKLAEMLSEVKEERTVLVDVFLHLYEICENYPEGPLYPLRLAESQIEMKDLPPEQTPWGQYILGQVAGFAKTAQGYITAAFERAAEEEEKNVPGCQKAYESDMAYFEGLLLATQKGYAATKEWLTGATVARLAVKVNTLPDFLAYKDTREAYKAVIKTYKEKFFSFTLEEWSEALAEMGHYSQIACKIVEAFAQAYDKEKQYRHICDFGDLEHKLVRLLYTDGKPNAIAASIASEFDYIYVDEYQDINRLQHTIIEAISRPNNRFMVGDIKQSIYSFRRAEPSLFAQMRKTFPPLAEAGDSPCASIHLSENFRSVETVISGINLVFDFLFGHGGESIGYVHEDRLKWGCGKPGEEKPKVVLCQRVDNPAEDNTTTETDEEETEDQLESNAPTEEAVYVAKEIRRLLSLKEDGKPKYRPGDITILLRSVKNKGGDFARALRDEGLEVELGDTRDFFLVPEVLLCLCLLGSVDNPLRDIYLAGLMQSPLFYFTQDDLTRIRETTSKETPLWLSVCEYSEAHPTDEKLKAFISVVKKYRLLAESIPVDRLLRRMYEETGLLSLASAKGGGRENLLLLYQYARGFEASEFKGLHAFIEYLNQLIATNNTIKTPPRQDPDPQKIRLMTIHASKGLQFPVTFVCGCGKAPNEMDLRSRLLFHSSLGLSMTQRDKSGFATVMTPIHEAVKDAIKKDSIEEEMRILYVAMTRAKERLYLVASPTKGAKVDSWFARARRLADAPTEWGILHARNYFTMICAAVGEENVEVIAPDEASAKPTKATETTTPAVDIALLEEIDRRFDTTYEYAYLHHIPGKLAVSRLSPVVLDQSENDMTVLARGHEGDIFPAFHQPDQSHLATDRGTATHLFMQFCDFSLLKKNGAKAELERLVNAHYIDQKTADLVRLEELERFRKSPLLAMLEDAHEVKREFRFHVRLPASDFTSDKELKVKLAGETVLVQGVIDCLVIAGDGTLTLIDYKTDRLTKEERASHDLAKAKLFARHGEQLRYYALAVASMFGQPPTRVGIYALHSGESYFV